MTGWSQLGHQQTQQARRWVTVAAVQNASLK
jgi:hypothetical protein